MSPSRKVSRKEQSEFALFELRLIYNRLNDSSDTLDQKSRALITSSSIIVTLFGSFQTYLHGTTQLQDQTALLVVIVLYLAELVVLLYIGRPQVYKLPFVADQAGLDRAILQKDSYEDSLNQMISNYLARIKHNKTINKNKASALEFANLLFVVNMIVVMAVSFSS